MAEIIVKIKRKPQQQPTADVAPRTSRRAALLRAAAPDDYLPRRRRLPGLINFYDLGQIRVDNAWTDLDFSIAPPITGLYPREPLQTEYETLTAKFFEVPLPDWQANYRKFDYENAYKYDINLKLNGQAVALDANNEKWTENGLQAQSVNRLEIGAKNGDYSHPFFWIDTNDAVNFKITGENDYQAESIAFNPSGEIDVFLVPLLGSMQIRGGTPNPPFNDAAQNFVHMLGGYFGVFPRAHLLDALSFIYATPTSAGNLGKYGNSNQATNFWIGHFRAASAARHRRYLHIQATTQNPVSQDIWETLPGSAFPDAPVSLTGGVQGIGVSMRIQGSYQYGDFGGGRQIYPGKLVAVVCGGNRTYYIWSKTATLFPANTRQFGGGQE